MGAALAYYTLFSIAPVLIIVIAVAGFFFGPEAASGEIVTQLRGLLGDDGAAAVEGLIESASEPEEGLVRDDLQHCATAPWGDDRLRRAAERSRPNLACGGSENGQRLWAFLRTRLLSFGMVLALAFLLLVSLVLSAALAVLGNWWGGWFEGWAVLLEILNFIVVVRDHDGTVCPHL